METVQNLAYHGRKLNWSDLIHLCFTRDRIFHIKMTERGKPREFYHLQFLITDSMILILFRGRIQILPLTQVTEVILEQHVDRFK